MNDVIRNAFMNDLLQEKMEKWNIYNSLTIGARPLRKVKHNQFRFLRRLDRESRFIFDPRLISRVSAAVAEAAE